MLDNIPELGENKSSGDFDFKNNITFSWSWTGIDNDRVLHIQITGFTLTAQQKTAIQNIADGRFGAGKVVID